MVRGFQEHGLDGTEDTYSPTPSHLTLRLALVIAASLDYTATNADFKTAFLNALIGLEECLFIHPPQGVTIEGHVLQLANALYGLASSPLRWFLLVSRLLTTYGLTPHADEPCLYWSIELQLIVVVYVDDCRVMGTEQSIAKLINFLNSHYPITVMASLPLAPLSYTRPRVSRTRAQLPSWAKGKEPIASSGSAHSTLLPVDSARKVATSDPSVSNGSVVGASALTVRS